MSVSVSCNVLVLSAASSVRFIAVSSTGVSLEGVVIATVRALSELPHVSFGNGYVRP